MNITTNLYWVLDESNKCPCFKEMFSLIFLFPGFQTVAEKQ